MFFMFLFILRVDYSIVNEDNTNSKHMNIAVVFVNPKGIRTNSQ